MRKILRSTAALILCGMLSIQTTAIAQNRHGGAGKGNGQRVESSRGSSSSRSGLSSRPDRNARPGVGTNTNKRPDNTGSNSNFNRPNTPTNNNRPGDGNNKRPNIGSNNRPGSENHAPQGSRPGVGNQPPQGNRPGVGNQPNRHPQGGKPTIGPNHAPSAPRPPHMAPPPRPYRPIIVRPQMRPVPPPGWRPRAGLPLIRGILGLTFGTALNLSLDYLYSSGYTVDGYGNDIVYLRNINALNYIWTDGALYYGANGLDGSAFYYSTPGYDLNRYNNVYNRLSAIYGPPVNVSHNSGIMSATWFGGNNGYISLSYSASNMSGAMRYLTTLSFGL